MDVSNKTLGLLLVAAIVVSVGGTLMSLNQLGEVSPTGFAASDSGTVDLTITQTASLTLDSNDAIDFGTCTVDSVNAFSYYNSSVGGGNYNNSLCSLVGDLPDELIIRNDGTIGINVEVNATLNGSTMFNSPSSAIYYHVTSPSSGCNGTLTTWSEITGSGAALQNLPVCTWLQTYSQNGNNPSTVEFDFAADVALGGYNTGNQLVLTFEATAN